MHRLANLYTDTLSSAVFLSRLPLWRLMDKESRATLPDFRNTAHTFPFAGCIIALPAIITLFVGQAFGLPSLILALMLITVLLITTGALHEDGLADVADGFWGGHTLEQKLEIMRDSHIGTYGVLALIASFALRSAALAGLLATLSQGQIIVILILTAALSRLAILGPWTWLPAIRPATNQVSSATTKKDASGLSIRYGEPNRDTLVWAIACASPLIVLAVWSLGLWATIVMLMAGTAGLFGVVALANQHIKGHTGDVLGASQQMSEIGLYIGLLIAI